MELTNDALGFMLHHSDLRLLKLQLIKFKAFGVTPEQWHLLNSLAEKDIINQKELAKRVDKNQTIVTRMLLILERKGFVKKEIDPNDRRAFLLYLTESGQKVQNNLLQLAEKTFETLLQDIPQEDVAKFAQVLNTVYQKLDVMIAAHK
ncbi:MAG: transcriptional regulator, MarR family [Firmicutes bacterium]|nr:transcriptional regulator, MarR family [Bacillota bacterium]